MPATAATGVEYELFDVAKQERLLGFALTARGNAMRDVAHQIADAVYEKILGVRGAFWTRIAYVTATGTGKGAQLRADGRRQRRLQPADRGALARAAAVAGVEPGRQPPGLRQLRARQLARSTSRTSPPARASWSPSFRGINGAPAFSPDGRRLALTLSQERQPRDLRDGPGQQAR